MRITKTIISLNEKIPDTVMELTEKVQKIKKLSEEDEYNFRLTLEEVITNAVRHGNENNVNLTVEIAIECDEQSLSIEVKDQGDGFDFNNLPDPLDKKDELKTSGRGLFLINKWADEVVFKDNGSKVNIIKKFTDNKEL